MDDDPLYVRRRFLASASVLAFGSLAGCSSDEPDGEGTPRNQDTPADGSSPADTAEPTPTDSEEPTATETEEPTPSESAKPSLSIGTTALTTVNTGYSERVIGEVTITNDGGAQIDGFMIAIDWLDDSDEFIASTDLYGRFLDAGETWVARSPAWLDVENPEQIAAVEASVADTNAFGDLAPNPDGIELTDQAVRASDEEVLVRGTVKNNQNTKEFINVASKATTADGTVLGMGDTIEEVPSGESWTFQMDIETYGRNGQVDSATVIPYVRD